MITAEQQADAQRSKAGDDLLDIAALRNSTPFNRYWMAHLIRKRDELRSKVWDEPADRCSPEEREILRRIGKAYDELLEMPAKHEAAARSLLDPPRQPDAKIEAAMRGIIQTHSGHS